MDNMFDRIRKMLKETYLEVASEDNGAKTISDCTSLTASRFRQVMLEKLDELEFEIKTEV